MFEVGSPRVSLVKAIVPPLCRVSDKATPTLFSLNASLFTTGTAISWETEETLDETNPKSWECFNGVSPNSPIHLPGPGSHGDSTSKTSEIVSSNRSNELSKSLDIDSCASSKNRLQAIAKHPEAEQPLHKLSIGLGFLTLGCDSTWIWNISRLSELGFSPLTFDKLSICKSSEAITFGAKKRTGDKMWYCWFEGSSGFKQTTLNIIISVTNSNCLVQY